MDTATSISRQKIRCDECGQKRPRYDIVHFGSAEKGYRVLCSRCFNTEVAKSPGLEGFEQAAFESMRFSDCSGEIHEFHFRTRLLATNIALDAFELRNGNPTGYFFQIIGEPGEDQLVLFGRLLEKMRRALSVKHLKNGDYGLQISDQGIVRGRIEWDKHQDGRPLLVIDGREINWDQFGSMLMSYEGWQLKLTIADKSEAL
jgi:hypothetical protein